MVGSQPLAPLAAQSDLGLGTGQRPALPRRDPGGFPPLLQGGQAGADLLLAQGHEFAVVIQGPRQVLGVGEAYGPGAVQADVLQQGEGVARRDSVARGEGLANRGLVGQQPLEEGVDDAMAELTAVDRHGQRDGRRPGPDVGEAVLAAVGLDQLADDAAIENDEQGPHSSPSARRWASRAS